MEKVDKPPTEKEIELLREGIQIRYNTYHLLDRDRFPAFEYNTNRANYEPLRKSFEEEFYTVRKVDKTNNSIHIPSTNTLARLFSEDGYVPGRKILNTCWSYAEGRAKMESDSDVFVTKRTHILRNPIIKRKVLLTGALLLTGLVIYTVLNRTRPALALPASGLHISYPRSGETVPRQLLTTGNVVNADTVWLVVHAVGGVNYWVQPPIRVSNDNQWRGGIYIGSDDKGDIGVRSHIQAFVNPRQPLKEGDVLYAWPLAEHASEKIEVIRGAAKE